MKKIKTFRRWSIYEATKKNDEDTFDGCKYAAYLPEESPHEYFPPEWCADSVKELMDFIKSY